MLIVLVVRQGVGMIVTLPSKRYRVPLFRTDSDNDGNPDACDDCSLPGYINCDGIVNLLDQALLALHWLETI